MNGSNARIASLKNGSSARRWHGPRAEWRETRPLRPARFPPPPPTQLDHPAPKVKVATLGHPALKVATSTLETAAAPPLQHPRFAFSLSLTHSHCPSHSASALTLSLSLPPPPPPSHSHSPSPSPPHSHSHCLSDTHTLSLVPFPQPCFAALCKCTTRQNIPP